MEEILRFGYVEARFIEDDGHIAAMTFCFATMLVGFYFERGVASFLFQNYGVEIVRPLRLFIRVVVHVGLVVVD